jgi:hypothetical protein
MSEILGKMIVFLLIWNLTNLRVSTRIKDKKKSLTNKKSIFSAFLTWVALEL